MGKPHSRSGMASAVGSTGGMSNVPCNQVVGSCSPSVILASSGADVLSKINDPVKAELCVIFCKTRQEWHACLDRKKANPSVKCDRPSKTAAKKTKGALGRADSPLNKAVNTRYPGSVGRAEKSFLALVDKKTAKLLDGARKLYDENKLKKAIERKIKQVAKRKALQKGAKMASRAWLKLVPGLNVIMTVIDVVDIAMTAADLIQMVRNAQNLADKAVRIAPDFAIEAPDGSVSQVYDYKFDNPATGYQDDWQKNGQLEAYTNATGKTPEKIDQDTCKCGKKPGSTGSFVGA